LDREFWLERWELNQLGFHRSDTNPLLARHWAELGITRGSGVFVPMCGKSLDMRYLESLGYQVYGVELSEKAIRAYFEEGGEEPVETEEFYLKRFRGPQTTIFHGDFFDLSTSDILGVRGVYDRGALVALPPSMRELYADHMQRIIPEHAHMLLLALDYDQSLLPGPPFAVPESEIVRLYSSRCRVTCVERIVTRELPPRFAEAGVESATETVFHIIKDR
jgi:thiopurine S-methyltransferase